MIVTDEHQSLLTELKGFVQPWRKLTIAVDGITGTGKSSLSRYLAWQLDMPSIDTDMYRNREDVQPSYRISDLSRVVEARHKMDRPVILEGIFLCNTLEGLSLTPDYLIFVENSDANCGSALNESLPAYLTKYTPKERAQWVFRTDFINM